MTGAITSHIDVAQVVLYVFWVFFAGLIFYLRREDKREGYPLSLDPRDRLFGRPVVGFPTMPTPKTFLLRDGSTIQRPGGDADTREIRAVPAFPFIGSPLQPTGDPMADGVGPAAWAERAERPDAMLDGRPSLAPLAASPGFHLEARDPDPRGMSVLGCDGAVAGTVSDVWIDRAEFTIRYLEVTLAVGAAGVPAHSVLLPINFSRIDGKRRVVRVNAITAAQFAGVPVIAVPDQVTLREEDRITGYFGGGTLYATPARQEPLL